MYLGVVRYAPCPGMPPVRNPLFPNWEERALGRAWPLGFDGRVKKKGAPPPGVHQTLYRTLIPALEAGGYGRSS